MDITLTTADLNLTVNHEPRIMDLRLAEALGFANIYAIRPLIARHLEALERFGSVSLTQEKPGLKGGRPGKTFWLNRKQALYITAKSDTDRAADVTVKMVEVFDEHIRSIEPVALSAPDLSRSGYALMRIGKDSVLVDTKRFKVGPNDRVVRIHFDGHIDVGTVMTDNAPNWYGPRGAKETWRKPRRGDPLTATKISSAVQVLGVVVSSAPTAH